MQLSQIIWMASLSTGSIAANTGLLKVITDDKIARPNVAAGFLNTLLSIIGGIFCYYILGLHYSIAFVFFNLISFIVLVYIITKRDKKAVIFAEKLFPTFQAIDLQIAFLLGEIVKGEMEDLGKPIRRALRFILSEIPVVFAFDSSHHTQSCILVPENYRFKVLAYSGIPNYKVDKMEEMFRYGEQPVSIAGICVNNKKTVIINDLTDQKNIDNDYWVKITNEETKVGSLLAHPIFRGIGFGHAEPIAVLCITSLKKNAFDIKETNLLLNFFSLKVEILQNSWDIVKSHHK